MQSTKANFRHRTFHVPNLIFIWVDSNLFSTAADLHGEPKKSHYQMLSCSSSNIMTSCFCNGALHAGIVLDNVKADPILA